MSAARSMPDTVDPFQQAMLTLIGKYDARVSTFTFRSYRDALRKVPPQTQIQALQLAPDFYPDRLPTAPEVKIVARAVTRYGYAAVDKASEDWVDDLGKEDKTRVHHLTPGGILEAARIAFAAVGNPETTIAGELVAHSDENEPPADEAFERAVAAKMAQGTERDKAIFQVIAERTGAAVKIKDMS